MFYSWFLFFCWTWDFSLIQWSNPLLCLQSLIFSFQFNPIYGWGSPELFHFGFLLRVCFHILYCFHYSDIHSFRSSFWYLFISSLSSLFICIVAVLHLCFLYHLSCFCSGTSLREDCVFSDDLFMWLVPLQWDLEIWSYFVGSVSWHGNRVSTLLTWCLNLSFHWPQLVRLPSIEWGLGFSLGAI